MEILAVGEAEAVGPFASLGAKVVACPTPASAGEALSRVAGAGLPPGESMLVLVTGEAASVARDETDALRRVPGVAVLVLPGGAEGGEAGAGGERGDNAIEEIRALVVRALGVDLVSRAEGR